MPELYSICMVNKQPKNNNENILMVLTSHAAKKNIYIPGYINVTWMDGIRNHIFLTIDLLNN